MSLNLWTPHGVGRGAQIFTAADIAKIQITHSPISYENLKTPEHLARHPQGKVPVLETPEGPIYESLAILRYIARKSTSLYGKNVWEQAEVENWLHLVISELDPFVIEYIRAIGGHQFQTKDRFNQIVKTLKDWSKSFDEYIKGKSYIVGDQVTIADISVANSYTWLFKLLLDDKTRPQLPNLLAWFQKVSTLP